MKFASVMRMFRMSEYSQVKFLLSWQCKKALVRAAIEHVLGEILRLWGLLKQICG